MNYEKYLIHAGVPEDLRAQALEYLAKCERDYRTARIAWHKATAWAVVGWLLLTGKVPFEAEALPERWKAYDNDVSINGDRGVWLWADNKEGTYAELQPCPLDDSALQYSYWHTHHPRSKWHRWLWLGTRNMASRLASDVGLAITPDMRPRLRSWGNVNTGRDQPGVVVYELDGHWQIYVVEPWYFGLVVRRNMGVKLSMAVPGLRRRAPLVMIKFSLLRGK
jgi:hypothetical protein